MLLIQTILLFFFPMHFNDTCLKLKLARQNYTSSDKTLNWKITNECNQTKYYLIGIEVKTDTGWTVLNSYVHALMQKDFMTLLEVKSKSSTTDNIGLSKIRQEKEFRGIKREYKEYRLD